MRQPTDVEVQLLRKVLNSTDGAEVLAQQLTNTLVGDDSTPSFLRLVVDGGPVSTFTDGPIPGRFPVLRAGDPAG